MTALLKDARTVLCTVPRRHIGGGGEHSMQAEAMEKVEVTCHLLDRMLVQIAPRNLDIPIISAEGALKHYLKRQQIVAIIRPESVVFHPGFWG